MKKIVVTAFSAFLILSFISCGSKPAPEETKEPEAPVVTEEVVVEEVEETVEPVDNSLVLQNVDDARNLAVESGAEESAADLLKSVDDLFAQIKAKSEEGQDVSKEAADIANRYSAIASYVKAKNTKQKIDDENLSSFAQSTYDEGCTVYAELETMFTNSEVTGEQLLEQATKAYTCFNSVLNIAYKQIAKDERSAAFVEKKNADSVKAGVAQKEKYNEAVELFKKGDTLYSMQNPEKAYENYKSSKEIFAAVYAEVSEKRAEAQKAIDEAKKRVAESAALANEADLNSPITEKVDGIEEEETVLLEEETFADPTQAEADLPETLDGENEEVVEETTALEEENTEEVVEEEVIETEISEEENSEAEELVEAEIVEETTALEEENTEEVVEEVVAEEEVIETEISEEENSEAEDLVEAEVVEETTVLEEESENTESNLDVEVENQNEESEVVDSGDAE